MQVGQLERPSVRAFSVNTVTGFLANNFLGPVYLFLSRVLTQKNRSCLGSTRLDCFQDMLFPRRPVTHRKNNRMPNA